MASQPDLSTFRLYLLRATYLFVAVGLGTIIWPRLLQPAGAPPEQMKGVVRAVLGAVSLLALLGIRYPVRMLPLLFFEFTWKAIWVLAIGLPQWRAGVMAPATRETWRDCLLGLVVFALAIPWGFAVRRYLLAPGDRWRARTAEQPAG